MSPLIAFDADVLIYAGSPTNSVGVAVAKLFQDQDGLPAGVGSVLLLTEVLSKPMREDDDSAEVRKTSLKLSLCWRKRRTNSTPLPGFK